MVITHKIPQEETKEKRNVCQLALYIYLHVSTWKSIWASAFVAVAACPVGDCDYSAATRENHTSSDTFMLCSFLVGPLIACMCQWWPFLVCLICWTSAPPSVHPLVDKTCFWSHSHDQSLCLPLCVLSAISVSYFSKPIASKTYDHKSNNATCM